VKRKVIQIADKTFVVSLPTEWVKRFNIAKGDELFLNNKDNDLVISQDSTPSAKTIRITISGLEERVVRWYLSALHKAGYDEIEIVYEKNQLSLIYELMKDLFTGFNTSAETNSSITLKSISSENKEDFNTALRRAFRITLLMGKELIDYIMAINSRREVNNQTLNNIAEKELLNNQLTNFCQRLINKYKFGGDKGTFLYAILWNLEKVCDNYKYILNELNSEGKRTQVGSQKITISKEIIEILEETNKYLEEYYELFYSYNLERLNKINLKTKQIKEKLNQIKPENQIDTKLLCRLSTLRVQITDFSASIIALNQK
jgi:hypothetical protein